MYSKSVSPGMIQIGYQAASIIDNKYERALIKIGQNGKLIFNGRCFVGSASKLDVHGELSFGSNVHITGRTDFICYKKIDVGNNSLISWDCLFMDTDFHKIYRDEYQINEDSPIQIGENTWIGCRVTCLKGANIPCNSVIGACSVVSSELNNNKSIYVGNPAKLIKENIKWEQ